MFNSAIIDVAIGLAFLFLLMSLIASVVQEILATFMQLRPANLQRGLRSLLSGNSIGSGMDLVDSIYNHGLVRGLYLDPDRDMNPDTQARKEQEVNPSDETKRRKVWLMISRVDWLREIMRRLIGIHPEKQISGVSNQMLLPAYIPSRTFALAMVDLLNKNKKTGKEAMIAIHDFLAAHHAEFKDNKATEAMLALAADAQGDLKKFQENLENWYNSAMDRASGWYKKYTQTLLLMIGLVLAITFNVDSVRVARVLWSDRDARQGMVDAAGQYMKDHPKAEVPTNGTSGDAAPAGGTVPAAPAGTTTVAAPVGAAAPAADANAPAKAGGAAAAEPFNASDLEKRVSATVEQFKKVTSASLLPVGWKHSFGYNWTYFWGHKVEASGRAVEYFPGWLVTALAVSLGAPFWFDLLNRFMVVRGTVKPQEKSATEPSKN